MGQDAEKNNGKCLDTVTTLDGKPSLSKVICFENEKIRKRDAPESWDNLMESDNDCHGLTAGCALPSSDEETKSLSEPSLSEGSMQLSRSHSSTCNSSISKLEHTVPGSILCDERTSRTRNKKRRKISDSLLSGIEPNDEIGQSLPPVPPILSTGSGRTCMHCSDNDYEFGPSVSNLCIEKGSGDDTLSERNMRMSDSPTNRTSDLQHLSVEKDGSDKDRLVAPEMAEQNAILNGVLDLYSLGEKLKDSIILCEFDKTCGDASAETSPSETVDRTPLSKPEEQLACSLESEPVNTNIPQFVNDKNILQPELQSFHASDHSCFPRKKLLVLDVNGLLADIVKFPPDGYQADKVIGFKSVFKRPFCDDFLQFCLERFSVGVWTSRTRKNIKPVIDFLTEKTGNKLLFCWDQSHCTETGFYTVESREKPLILKELKKLWEMQDPNLPWARGDYNESNTLLVDDSPYKALLNPPNTAIFPHSYNYWDKNDNALGPGGAIRLYLEGLAVADDVQRYVAQNRLGQRPITETNISWRFYSKVIASVSSQQKAGPVLHSAATSIQQEANVTSPSSTSLSQKEFVEKSSSAVGLLLEVNDKNGRKDSDSLINCLEPRNEFVSSSPINLVSSDFRSSSMHCRDIAQTSGIDKVPGHESSLNVKKDTSLGNPLGCNSDLGSMMDINAVETKNVNHFSEEKDPGDAIVQSALVETLDQKIQLNIANEVYSVSELESFERNVTQAVNKDNMPQDVLQSPQGRNHSTRPQKKLLVLDINGLLADIVSHARDGFQPDAIIGSDSVFKRPFCDDFLQFCFERFNVGVWLSRKRRHVQRAIDFIMNNTGRRYTFCWDYYNCTRTGFSTVENSEKPLLLKELKKLWEKNDSNLPWDQGDYDESNTLLLDEYPPKALRNPPNTAIFPLPFRHWENKDDFLGPGGPLQIYLEGLALADNVQDYVAKNPFGQRPITERNLSWRYYLKVLGSASEQSKCHSATTSLEADATCRLATAPFQQEAGTTYLLATAASQHGADTSNPSATNAMIDVCCSTSSQDVWLPPAMGSLKFSVDGYYESRTELAGCGGILRDHKGHVLAIFSIPLGTADSNFAKLESVRIALDIYIKTGSVCKDDLLIEIDSVEVLDWVTNIDKRPCQYSTCFKAIDDFIMKIGQVKLVSIRSSINGFAQAMAKQGGSRKVDWQSWW